MRLIDADDFFRQFPELDIEPYNNAPTVEEQPKGKWIPREDMNYLDENRIIHEHFMCDRCGLIHDFIDGHTTQYKYCPNCGVQMEDERQ